MTESIFHMTERKDSLDIMLEMNMENLLKHPVIVEVLNLAYEGKYSADGSALSLSQTFSSFFMMEISELKSIHERLMLNIKSFGESGSGKQSNLQFNIWKQCINQREQDEMILTVLFCLIVLYLILNIDHSISSFMGFQRGVYGSSFLDDTSFFVHSEPKQLIEFCPEAVTQLLEINSDMMALSLLMYFAAAGFLTAICQKIIILRFRDNVELQTGRILLEMAIVVSSTMYIMIVLGNSSNTLITDICAGYADFQGMDQNIS